MLVEALVEPALALAPRLQHPAGDDPRLAGAGPQVRQHGPLEHVLHLVGHARARRTRPCRRPGRSAPARCRGSAGSRSRRRAPGPGAGCSPASAGSRLANSSRMTSATASSCTSSTPPITAAIASRVTSSWVGPRPPVTITASASSSSRRSARLDAPDVVADLDLQQRPDAVQGQPITDPRRVGVVDLTEQELRPDGEDVTAHGADRRTSARSGRHADGRGRRLGAGRRAGSRSRTPAPARRPTTGSLHDPRRVDGRRSAAIAKPTAICWASVLLLASRLAGRLTPRAPTTLRYTLTMNSRAAMITTGTTQNTPLATSVNIAPSTRTLSASGSRKAPERLGPRRRATQPSNASLAHSTNHRANADPAAVRVARGWPRTSAARAATGPTVMALAQLARAVGSSTSALAVRVVVTAAPTATRSGPSASTIATSARTPTPRSCPTWTTPSISGASRCERPTPGASTSTSTVRPISASRRRGGDRRPAARSARRAARRRAPLAPARRDRRRTCRPRGCRRRSRTSRDRPPPRSAAARRGRARSRPGSRR